MNASATSTVAGAVGNSTAVNNNTTASATTTASTTNTTVPAAAAAASTAPVVPNLGGSAGGGTLDQLNLKRQQLLDDLRLTEKYLFDIEELYIEDSIHYGNISRGWDSLISAKIYKPTHSHTNKKARISTKERIFSASSITAPKSEEELSLLSAGGSIGATVGYSQPDSGQINVNSAAGD